MSFASYPLKRIEETLRSVSESSRTLPDWLLQNEIEAMRQACAGTIGATPAGLLLRALEAEQVRRRQGALL